MTDVKKNMIYFHKKTKAPVMGLNVADLSAIGSYLSVRTFKGRVTCFHAGRIANINKKQKPQP